MHILKSANINLRALEPEDLEFLFSVENNDSFWEVSDTLTPYSRHILKKYIENSYQDIFEAKQLRLVIESVKFQDKIGFIDLFDFNPQHRRAGIGILILQKYQNKGYASEVLKLFINYAFKKFNLHQVYANIPVDNSNSIKLFEKFGFKKTGIKKNWIVSSESYKDVYLYQLLNNQ